MTCECVVLFCSHWQATLNASVTLLVYEGSYESQVSNDCVVAVSNFSEYRQYLCTVCVYCVCVCAMVYVTVKDTTTLIMA